jgi:hypothetical protein
MELKSVVVIETKKNDRIFQFSMPVGAPFGECYDACFEVLNKVVELSKEAAEAAKPKESEDSEKAN